MVRTFSHPDAGTAVKVTNSICCLQPTEFELRQRNQQFANKARAGKNPVNPSRKEKLQKRSPISTWALGMIAFVLIGGGLSDSAIRLSLERS